jgi:cleavage and polyadenylation specificity factor subunit 2
VLIEGNAEETNALREECEKLLQSVGSAEHASEIFTPFVGQVLNASADTNAWNIKLSIPLRQRLIWQTVGSLGVVPLTGQLRADILPLESESVVENKAKRVKSVVADSTDLVVTDSTSKDVTPVLDIVPTISSASTRMLARPLHLGDLRLMDLRRAMQDSGFAVEYRGEGTLVINGLVAVRKSATGNVEVETVIGVPGFSVGDQTFEEVRKRIYSSLAIISGR